jgi:hypothetical protein
MKNCDHINCDLQATYKGHIYGRVSGSNDKDSFIPVNACDTHSEDDGFYPDKPLSETE